MKIDKLLRLVEATPVYRRLLEQLARGDARALVLEEARPYFLAALFRSLNRPVMIITARPDTSLQLTEQIAAWQSTGAVWQMPEPDAMSYQRATPDSSTALERVETISALINHTPGNLTPLVVVSAAALARKLPDAAIFRNAGCQLKQGMSIGFAELMSDLLGWGYSVENLVEVPGQIARRGGIVDIFPPTSDLPVRLEFFGNEIESMRLFEPVSQRSLKPVKKIDLGPASELSPVFIGGKDRIREAFGGLDLTGLTSDARLEFDQTMNGLLEGHTPEYMPFYTPLFNRDNLLSYLPQDSLIVYEPEELWKEIENLTREESRILKDKKAAGEVPEHFPSPNLTRAELEPLILAKPHLALAGWQGQEEGLRLEFKPIPGYAGLLPRWIEKVISLQKQGSRVIAVSHQASRLADMLHHEKPAVNVVEELGELPPAGSLTLVQGLLSGGWVLDGTTYLFTDKELFGFLKQQRRLKRRAVVHSRLYIDIKPGDFVVHIEHGISKFSGVTSLVSGGVIREFMILQYAAGDRLFVPTDQIDRVSRYIGASDNAPTLNRLGSTEWVKSKERAKEAAKEVARELLSLYAAREITPGFAYSPDNIWQMELETSFPYVETPDQLTAIAQIKEDMSQPKPMDRLVTGDVGYGKTEVAIRAAFKAVMNGKQVAVLVPTTVLAQQHYATFKERLGAFPVQVDVLSRFRSRKEQKQVLERLAQGQVDIVIGTHRLLQKDVAFKDLGLVVIDEEQRFGVAHKEYFKKLRREVGVLTLSATPIPRTLHMSLVGVRDMSVMETPPEERLPIKTYVAEYDDRLVREAISRELERGGQVFFVHNRVQSIAAIAEKLRQLVPNARLGIGHGQMEEDKLELVMSDFVQGRIDILLCTTIIESGLDVPNANTLIVNQADRMGLTQLYQLRGRVGRGANMAYAYFLHDRGKRLTQDAGKRLRTIFEATELGAGFGIAMKDLEIRGAGNILGLKQSGNISAVGFNLYTQLLSEAVEDLKAQQVATKAGQPVQFSLHLPPPTIDLPVPVFIPEEYVSDTEIRLSLYQCLAGTRNLEAVNVWLKDFQDRFGPPPVEVQNLLYAIKIKVLATKAALASVSHESGQIVLRPPPGKQFDLGRLNIYRKGVKISPYQVRLDVDAPGGEWQKKLVEVLGWMC